MGFSTARHLAEKFTEAFVAIPFRVGWGFQQVGMGLKWLREHVAIPFRVGWGFQRRRPSGARVLGNLVAIPFRVGWGFQPNWPFPRLTIDSLVAIPFRVGWGFQLLTELGESATVFTSQSLSGWGGVFNEVNSERKNRLYSRRNPFQGGVGFSTGNYVLQLGWEGPVAIPFRVGWGFQQ